MYYVLACCCLFLCLSSCLSCLCCVNSVVLEFLCMVLLFLLLKLFSVYVYCYVFIVWFGVILFECWICLWLICCVMGLVWLF